MPTSLGLEGDLDDVELIQYVEEAFDLRFSDTVGVAARLAEPVSE